MKKQLLVVSILAAALGAAACKHPAAEQSAAMPEATMAAPAETMADTMGDNRAAMAAMGPATYKVEFTPLWTKANFPVEYPDTSLIHRPHFSGLIGAGHNASYHLYALGQPPTPGLERLSEQGKHDALDAEIKAAVAAGNALALAESEPLKDFSQTASTQVQVDGAHPMVSLVAMIAPSPDWFAGVSDVSLMENGAWVATKTVDVQPYDSGGDDGDTYLASDADANPKRPTGLNQDRHFTKDGAVMPVARITFTKM
ncbi:MAG TPA: spondin domain-containing protein [Thermoanaerobaculia bacterium]|nr:spondin domain-containing protein [Thermoanaerobaculia bacterium]